MLKKLKIIGFILCFGVFICPFFIFALSEDVFPKTLNGVPLTSIEEEQPDEEIVSGYYADYENDTHFISVIFWQVKSTELAEEIKQSFFEELKVQYNELFERVDWQEPYSIEDNQSKVVFFTLYFSEVPIEAGAIITTIDEYVVVVQILDREDKPSIEELNNASKELIKNISNDDPGEEPNQPNMSDDCGDGNCQYWDGEDCKNCREDCYIDDFCCSLGYSYIYANDYHNSIYNIKEALGGLIPNGAIALRPGLSTEDLPLRSPSICKDGSISSGDCFSSYHCSNGVCMNNYCKKALAEEPEEVSQEMAEAIYEDQTNYKEEYVDAYYELEDSIIQMRVRDASLKVNLEVQGNTSGKVIKTNKGDEIEARLSIINDSDYSLALTAGIFYTQGFDLEEKKYTISFKWDGGLSSLVGSFKTKLINCKYIILSPGAELIVYSRVVPQETGYLDVQGLIFYNTEKKYQKWDARFLENAPPNYQETEVSDTILINEKPCSWWPICL